MSQEGGARLGGVLGGGARLQGSGFRVGGAKGRGDRGEEVLKLAR